MPIWFDTDPEWVCSVVRMIMSPMSPQYHLIHVSACNSRRTRWKWSGYISSPPLPLHSLIGIGWVWVWSWTVRVTIQFPSASSAVVNEIHRCIATFWVRFPSILLFLFYNTILLLEVIVYSLFLRPVILLLVVFWSCSIQPLHIDWPTPISSIHHSVFPKPFCAHFPPQNQTHVLTMKYVIVLSKPNNLSRSNHFGSVIAQFSSSPYLL